MKLALLQPQFAPNLYDLAAMLKADLVIWQDVEKWSRKGRTHRAKIRGQNGLQWINLPIVSEDKENAIKEVRIDQSEDWLTPFWNAIYHNYRTATYFDLYVDELRADLEKGSEFNRLLDFDLFMFKRLMLYLELQIDPVLSSELTEYSTYPDELKHILHADELYLEHNSKNYQRKSKYSVSALVKHPIYKQADREFISGASVLDLLLNYGKESFRIIDELTKS